jgi:hypothetical protein
MTEGVHPSAEEIQRLVRSLMDNKVIDKAASDFAWKQRFLGASEADIQEAGSPKPRGSRRPIKARWLRRRAQDKFTNRPSLARRYTDPNPASIRVTNSTSRAESKPRVDKNKSLPNYPAYGSLGSKLIWIGC